MFDYRADGRRNDCRAVSEYRARVLLGRIRLAVDLGSPWEHESEWTSVMSEKREITNWSGGSSESREAVMASVTREEFKIRSELEVVHIPTGAVFSAYPYSNPDDMLESVRVNWGRASATAESSGDYAEQVRRAASRLLLEQALRAVRVRRLSDAA